MQPLKTLLFGILLSLPTMLCAQSGTYPFQLRTQFGTALTNKNTSSLLGNVSLNYQFTPRWSVGFGYEGDVKFVETTGVKRYFESQALGLSLTYNAARLGQGIFQLEGAAHHSVFNNDFDYTSYRFGANYALTRGRFAPFIAAGLRFQQSHTALFKDKLQPYIGIGFSLGF